MARGRIFRRGNSRYLELPPELSDCDELELFCLKEGYYLICKNLPGNGQEKKGKPKNESLPVLSEDERRVLKKLFSIRFEKRVPSNVKRIISMDDAATLDKLIGRKLVNILKSGKYPEGVYNIDNGIYAMLNPRNRQIKSPQKSPQKKENPYSSLMKKGFLVLKDKNEALGFSEKVKSEIRSGKIKGIKGFDNKFYAVTQNYLDDSTGKVIKALSEDGSIDQIAERSGLEQDGCKAIIRLLAEKGDVIEKKKGIFSSV
jgi:hypothetical protein